MNIKEKKIKEKNEKKEIRIVLFTFVDLGVRRYYCISVAVFKVFKKN